ncbi:uncharacterized protein LOC116604069 isoform X2 [Nematostella vectensis]|uniref:uncharacterized protein LOC116604069 isoform X2 n=1 Tax=Nematostella vectensis TaxID=45351 RepID=UPI002076F483|nr:uncharacterized protein LOC116604069 isoform X2 [Nematostella vectensis]
MISTFLWLFGLLAVPKHNDSVPAVEKIKLIKKNSPPCHNRGWSLNTVANGVRIWNKVIDNSVSHISGLVYACSVTVPASLQDIMSAMEDHKCLQEWDPTIQNVSMVTVSQGHDVLSAAPVIQGSSSELFIRALQYFQQDTSIIHSRYWKTIGTNEGWLFATCMQNAFPCVGFLWYSILISQLDSENQDDPECVVTMTTAPTGSPLLGPSPPQLLASRLAGLKDYFINVKLESLMSTNSIKCSTEEMLDSVDFSRNQETEDLTSGSSSEHIGIGGEFLEVKENDSHVVYDNSRTDALLQELLQVYNAQTGTDGWTLIGTIKEVEIMKRPAQSGEKPFDTYKGVGLVNVPIHYVLAYIFRLDFRGEWDDLFLKGKMVEYKHPLAHFNWMEYRAIWPTSGRDFCNYVVMREVTEGLFAVAAQSTEHHDCPPVKNLVRAEVLLGGFLVREMSSDPPCCQVTYVSRVDLKGNLPPRLVNRVTQSQPQAVAVLRDKLESRYRKEAQQIGDENMSDLQSFGVDLWVELMKAKESRASGNNTPEMKRGKPRTPEKSRRRKSPEVRKRTNESESTSIDSEVLSEEVKQSRDIDDTSMDSTSSVLPVNEDNIELPFDRHVVDYKTLGNQAAATLMGAIVLASKVEISVTEEPNQQMGMEGEWSFQSVEKDVVILRKVSPGQKIHSFLGRGIIKVSPIAVWEAARNHMTRHVYDKTLKKTKIIKQIDDSSKLLYMHHETAQCFVKQARDFVLLTVERVEPEKYVIAGVSVESADCPSVKELVRGKVFASGWVIEPVLQDGQLYSMVSYLSQIDFGGIMPARLVNYVARRQPLCIAYLREYLEKFKEDE